MIASFLFYALLASSSTANAYSLAKSFTYSVVPGIFQQDDPATDPSTFNFTASNFGLIPRPYPSDPSCPNPQQATQWQRLSHYITTLNAQANSSDRYTLLFLGRHGEGFHNAAESYFGTPAWNCHWAVRNGNATVTWADAQLTPLGAQQATQVRDFWQHLLTDEKISPPDSYYTSPLYRCLTTADLSFSTLDLPASKPFKPIVKEFLREGISAHTCDRRSDKSFLERQFPAFAFEAGFQEEDPYWMEMKTEPRENQDARSKAVLDDIFGGDRASYISVTAHSGAVSSLLRVLNHRPFRLSTGSAMPVLVKITSSTTETPPSPALPYTPKTTCAVPPTIREPSCNDCSCCV
ncbi:hypothetical protein IAQ61_009312 [Plenodomus lingam]|uniref:uncharacterized protein n=1 Tax=Leptosphaeria maculans TaxID=5022 RepID=UPI003325D41A|nr:hypothetical protein IAQ61_009312 [Plenodomus lingam]